MNTNTNSGTQREIEARVFFYNGSDYSTGEMISLADAFSEGYIEFKGNKLIPVDECSIIIRYAGLQDNKGDEIFEGDVVGYPDGLIRVVEFNDVYFYFKSINPDPKKQYRDIRMPGDEKLYKYEIIGNIYQHPELLNT